MNATQFLPVFGGLQSCDLCGQHAHGHGHEPRTGSGEAATPRSSVEEAPALSTLRVAHCLVRDGTRVLSGPARRLVSGALWRQWARKGSVQKSNEGRANSPTQPNYSLSLEFLQWNMESSGPAEVEEGRLTGRSRGC